VILIVNGASMKVNEGATIPDVIAALEIPSVKGLAVAVDGRVIPRSEWDTLGLQSGTRVEVLRAVQGG
jgi:sulfur carrier protein